MRTSDRERRQRSAWDNLYSKNHAVWKGPPDIEIPFQIGDRVLELGCGNGKTLQSLLSSPMIIALDFSESAISRCYMNPLFHKVGFVIGDVRDLPFVSDAFDSVICVHVLEHLSAPDRALVVDEINRVLSAGGNLFLRVFSSADMRASKGEMVEEGTRIRVNGIPYHYFNEEELNRLFERMSITSLRKTSSRKIYGGEEFRREVFEVVTSKLS